MTARKLDWVLQRSILIVVASLLVWGPLAFGGVLVSGQAAIHALIGLAAVLWGVRLVLNRELRLLLPPVTWLVLLFTVYTLIRWQTAEVEYLAREEWLQVLSYALLFFVVVNNLHDRESARVLCIILIVVAGAISMYAILQYLGHWGTVWGIPQPLGYRRRASGTYVNPNHLAGFLGMVLPLAAAYGLSGRFSPTVRLVLGYAALTMLVALGMTLSRGGWLAGGAALIFLMAELFARKRYIVSVTLGVLLLAVAGSVLLGGNLGVDRRWEKLAASWKGTDEDARSKLWPAAWQIWGEHPWWGLGPNHFDQAYPAFRSPYYQERPIRVHNDYLNTLVDYGVAGTTIVAVAWVILFAGLFRGARSLHEQLRYSLRSGDNLLTMMGGAAAGLVAMLVHSMFDFNMHILANAVTMVTLMALVAGQVRVLAGRVWFQPGTVVRVVALASLIGAVSYLELQSVRRLKEHNLLREARLADPMSQDQLETLMTAWRVEPGNPETAYTIGHWYQNHSWRGGADHREQGERAVEWFGRAVRLNPYFAYAHAHLGMCLHWVGQAREATKAFETALRLDPEGWYTLALYGWHLVQLEQFKEAAPFFDKSLQFGPNQNPIARAYRDIVASQLARPPSALDRAYSREP